MGWHKNPRICWGWHKKGDVKKPKRSSAGTDGTDGMEDQKCSSFFYILGWYIEHVYIYVAHKQFRTQP